MDPCQSEKSIESDMRIQRKEARATDEDALEGLKPQAFLARAVEEVPRCERQLLGASRDVGLPRPDHLLRRGDRVRRLGERGSRGRERA